MIGDVFTTHFANYHFDESKFSILREGKEKQLVKEITQNNLSYLDPCTKKCNLEVQKIIHLQSIANQLLDAFIHLKRVTKSYILASNALIWIDVPIGQSIN